MTAILIVYTLVLATWASVRMWSHRKTIGSPYRFFFLRQDRPRSFDHALGLMLGTLFVIWVLSTAHSLGFTRDEGFYFDASKSYAGWFEAFLSPDP